MNILTRPFDNKIIVFLFDESHDKRFRPNPLKTK